MEPPDQCEFVKASATGIRGFIHEKEIPRRRIFQDELVKRTFILKSLTDALAINPEKIIEVGSAGCLAVPLAHPEKFVCAYDIDLPIFSNETNYFKDLPSGYYGPLSMKHKRVIDKRLRNYHRIIGDAECFAVAKNSFDLAIVFNEASLFSDSSKEMSGALSQGGYLVHILGVNRQRRGPSYYDGRMYTTHGYWSSLRKQPTPEGLEAIAIPESLKRLEFVPTVVDKKRAYCGAVFDIFRKPRDSSRKSLKNPQANYIKRRRFVRSRGEEPIGGPS